MQNVQGSVDDEANIAAARLVRERGLNTLIPGSGMIASGGTDFFLAGVKRTVQPGAKIGVHSWTGNPNGTRAMVSRFGSFRMLRLRAA